MPQNALVEELEVLIDPPSTNTNSPPPIKKTNITLAILSHIQNIITNIFSFYKFLTFLERDDKFSEQIAIPFMLLFASGTTITFLSSILPAVMEHNYHPNPEINYLIKICRKALFCEASTLPLKKNREYKIPIFIDRSKLNDINEEDFKKIIDEISKPPYDYEPYIKIIYVNTPYDLISSDSNPQPSTKYGYQNNAPLNLLYYGHRPKCANLFKPVSVIDIDKGYLKRIIFEYIPSFTLLTHSLLAFNHVIERFFGNSDTYKLGTLWFMETSALFFAIPKIYTNLKRKFTKARENWERLIYFLSTGTGGFCISNRWKFIWKAFLPSSAAIFTYTVGSLSFVIFGAVDQLAEIACSLTDKKLCSFKFDTFHPQIPEWQYRYIAYPSMFFSFLTIIFTQVFSNFDQYKKETALRIEEKTKIVLNGTQKPTKLWNIIKTGIFIDAFQSAISIFVGLTISTAYLLNQSTKDILPILISTFFASLSGFSYFLFQIDFAKTHFYETVDTFATGKKYIAKKGNHLLLTLNAIRRGVCTSGSAVYQIFFSSSEQKPLSNGIVHNTYGTSSIA